MGFQLDEMVGDIYREEMRVKVAHQEGTEGILRISECLSPAIYFSSEAQNELLKKAEVVVRGEG